MLVIKKRKSHQVRKRLTVSFITEDRKRVKIIITKIAANSYDLAQMIFEYQYFIFKKNYSYFKPLI